MRKYFKDFIIGLVIGLVYFWGSVFLNIEFIGSRIYKNTNLTGVYGLIIFGLFFVVLGVVPFALYVLTSSNGKKFREKSKKILVAFLSFSVGIYIAYLSFFVLALRAFSNFGF